MSNPLINGLVGAIGATFGRGTTSTAYDSITPATMTEEPVALYAMMRALAGNTNAYKSIAAILPDYGLENTAIQGLRNPTNAVCSFYETNLWPGTIREDDERSALPLEMPDLPTAENLNSAVHNVWRWSNWNDQKDGAAYDAAMLGDQMLKVVSDRNTRRAWFELLQPEYVTDLDIDGRGYLTYIRVDVPQIVRAADGSKEAWVHTEVWDKDNMRFRRWMHKQTAQTGTDQLGTPDEDEDLEQVFGVDFVPFVHWKFDRESNNMRGVPAVMRALDKIILLDVLATALHRRLGREVDWVLEGTGTDPDGMPLPAPSLTDNGGTLNFGSGYLHRLPSGWQLRDLIAGLDYAAHLAVVQDFYQSLRETDLNELTWGAVSESATDSGRAINYKLTPAKSKLDKARGRGEASLIRATQMCLSVAQGFDAPGFSESDIGTYADGALDFWIADRPLVPLSESEQSEIETQRVARVQTLTQAGLGVDEAMALENYSDDEIEQATQITSGVER